MPCPPVCYSLHVRAQVKNTQFLQVQGPEENIYNIKTEVM
jgi:hypothetical protein